MLTNVSKLSDRQFSWNSVAFVGAIGWLSGSLLLDLVIMPMLYATGMMEQDAFVSAGYSLFWLFNRLELVCAGVLLTAILAIRYNNRLLNRSVSTVVSGCRSRWALELGCLLVAIALIYTYGLTPTMSALGASVESSFETGLSASSQGVPEAMNWMHGLYWSLEALKLMGILGLIKLCYQDVAAQFEAALD
jgi:hypothetical protein